MLQESVNPGQESIICSLSATSTTMSQALECMESVDLGIWVMYFIVLIFYHDISDSFAQVWKSLWSTLYITYIFFLPGVCTAYKLDCKCKIICYLYLLFGFRGFLTLSPFSSQHMVILVCYVLWLFPHLLWKPSVPQTNSSGSYGSIFQ